MSYFDEDSGDIEQFRALVTRETNVAAVPRAVEIGSGIPIYDISDLTTELNSADRRAIQAEWAEVLSTGPGALVLRGMMQDAEAVDDASRIYLQIIDEEQLAGSGGGDHFADAGSNARIWNSLQKLCLRAPETFARYFGNTALNLVCEAWLGPAYQMTAQVNLVYPGGKAQNAHRDYHLGFMSAAQAAAYPVRLHELSSRLTLQGAVAHCDMPVESGPTKLLPHSHKYGAGYVAMNRAEFQQVFEEHCVQLPLRKGDGLFFNPALFHAAGSNGSGVIERLANLLQISSAFGRAMESVDRRAMCRALYPVLQRIAVKMGPARVDAAIAACAEGYPFPTNLDKDPPLDGMAPESQAGLMRRALQANMPLPVFEAELDEFSRRRDPGFA